MILKPDTFLQNRYRIVCRVGDKSGMGVVYKAIDTSNGKTVAVKQTFATDEKLLKAFRLEGDRLKYLNHPSLPKVMDQFNEDGEHFLVMDYIEGDDLKQLLSKQNDLFPVERVLGWADQLLEVLEFLHSQLQPIIHRDIKPANLKLNPKGEIVLLDFGLAKGLPTELADLTSDLSVTGGTRPYEPLEQANNAKTDARSDLYALGATLYHLLTGVQPPVAGTRAMELLSGQSDPLGMANKINPNVPPEVSAVINQALAIHAAQRPASAAEMRRMLREAAKSPVDPVPPPILPPPDVLPEVSPAPLLSTLLAPTQPVVYPPQPEHWNMSTLPVQPRQGKPLAQTLVDDLGKGVQMELVLIPSGSFVMGSSDAEVQAALKDAKRYNKDAQLEWFTREQPQHQVTISQPFYLGRYQVTQVEWEAVMGNNPSRFKGDVRLPVETVSWNDIQEFLSKLNARGDGYRYRLPSEAEWEYACRAGTTTPFAFGATVTPDQVNYDGNYPYGSAPKGEYRGKTTPVDSFEPNAWGLYDMHGNVWEWCQDRWHDSYTGAPADGSAWGSGSDNFRVLRGGSWRSNARSCRSAYRGRYALATRARNSGFRVVCVPRTEN